MLLVIGIFVYGFFKFTWSLRQFNYLCALIGSAPLPPVSATQRATTAEATATMLTQAVGSSNAGTRAYYFALAALAWFVHPGLFIAATTWMLGVLLARQLRSPSLRAVEGQVRQLAAMSATGRGRDDFRPRRPHVMGVSPAVLAVESQARLV
jgi:uncharacterized membrane protein